MSNVPSSSANSRWFKFIAFLSLTDTEILAKSGQYDRMLTYAMVFRQLVTFVFTTMLFTYGVSLFVDFTAAIVVGIVFSMTLFFLDQAIIGSDWALRNPFKRGLPIRTLIGLIPRIIYSLIIAYGLATLAEISLQADAIDEQIQKDVVQNNQPYFNQMSSYEDELDASVIISKTKIEGLQLDLEKAKETREELNTSADTHDIATIANSLENQIDMVAKQKAERDVDTTALNAMQSQLLEVRKEYAFWFNEALLERTGRDGRAPTEGPKYQRAVATYTDLLLQIPEIEKTIIDLEAKLVNSNAEVEREIEVLNELQRIENNLTNRRQLLLENETRLSNLQEQIDSSQKEMSALINDKQLKLKEYKEKLENDGLFYQQKTGFLSRYLALKSLHADPELGQAAIMFGYLLKVFFVAIELMPVIIKLFFSPFSFYSLRMYRKMQEAILKEKIKLESLENHYAHKSQKQQRTNQVYENDYPSTVPV